MKRLTTISRLKKTGRGGERGARARRAVPAAAVLLYRSRATRLPFPSSRLYPREFASFLRLCLRYSGELERGAVGNFVTTRRRLYEAREREGQARKYGA